MYIYINRTCSKILFKKMILMFFILFSFSFCEILDSITSEINLKTYRKVFDESGEVEIFITTSYFYLIFIEVPYNSTLYEYEEKTDGIYELINTTSIYDIELYKFVEYPFSKFVISMPNPGTLSFSYGSFQDMCENGIILSNYDAYSIVLSSYFSNYTQVKKSDDKCIVFANPSPSQTYLFDLAGVNGRVIVYQNGAALAEYSGTTSKYSIFDESKSPVIIRIIAHESLSLERIRIAMSSYACTPYCSWTLFNDPKSIKHCPTIEKCTLYKALHVTEILISLGVLVFVLIITVLSIYCYRKHKKAKSDIRSDVSKQTNDGTSICHEKGENVSEPTGYYVMAPILNIH